MNRVGANSRLKIVSGRTHPQLAAEIADSLGIKLSEVLIENFANGEVRVRYHNSVRGNDLFIVQTHYTPIHESFIEQLLLIDAAKRASARSITAVCPLLS